MLLHGGHWREQWERDLMDDLAVDLARRGYATWNLEYRRVGPSGGGWPVTFADVAIGIDHLAVLAQRYPLDPARVAVVGHSAGAQLGMWAATRRRLPPGAPGASGAGIGLGLVLSLAGVPDLVHSSRLGIDLRAVDSMMGGTPTELPEAYPLASPAERLPLECPCVVVVGDGDSPDIVEENRLFCARAVAAGQELEVCELPGADHFSVIDPRAADWPTVAALLARHVPPGEPPERFRA